MKCRSCGSDTEILVDLGSQPLANSYLDAPSDPDPIYPLVAYTCTHCLLVQVDHTVTPADIFTDYAFVSGASAPWITHCAQYAHAMMARYDPRTVVEIASNDGTLLRQFPSWVGVLGVDPAANIASKVETIHEFFTDDLAGRLPRADLLVANNVLGHVPDLHDFVAGMARVLAPNGVCTIESPHLVRLLSGCQFDTIYHEHYNYWSLHALERLLHAHGLAVFDVEILGVHGGSLRYYIDHGVRPETPTVDSIRALEHPYTDPHSGHYTTFQHRVDQHLHTIRHFFTSASTNRYTVGGIGAPAKANTLLNAAHVTQLAWTTDTSPHKQGKYLPGSHVPICRPEILTRDQPDYAVIFAWNWADAIMEKHADFKGQFVVPPRMEIV